MNRRFIKTMALLAAVVTVSAAPLSLKPDTVLTAHADYEEPQGEGVFNNIMYQTYSDHAVIMGGIVDEGKGINMMTASSITIPSEIEGLPVTSIGSSAFSSFQMKSVTLPDTLQEIGQYAFSYCSNLESVTFPDSLKRIEFQAFEDCSALSAVEFPDHLVETSSNTFTGTPWLEAQRKKDPLVIVNGALIDGQTCKGDVTVPASVKYVAGSAFSYNTDITSVVLPAGAAKVEDNVFSGCENLTSAELKGVTELGYEVFCDCDKLVDIKLSGKLTSINSGAFDDNDGTATITFYGTEEAWKKVDKYEDDEYLKRAKMVFDPNGGGDDPVVGDINADGVCDLSDVKLLRDWLIVEPDIVLADWKAGDMNSDGKLNGADLALIKCFLPAK